MKFKKLLKNLKTQIYTKNFKKNILFTIFISVCPLMKKNGYDFLC